MCERGVYAQQWEDEDEYDLEWTENGEEEPYPTAGSKMRGTTH